MLACYLKALPARTLQLIGRDFAALSPALLRQTTRMSHLLLIVRASDSLLFVMTPQYNSARPSVPFFTTGIINSVKKMDGASVFFGRVEKKGRLASRNRRCGNLSISMNWFISGVFIVNLWYDTTTKKFRMLKLSNPFFGFQMGIG